MERPSSIENFEDFKNKIAKIFRSEGFSEYLNSEIEKWHGRRQQKTDMLGGTIEQRVNFQIELALIYTVIGKNDLAVDTLNDALCQASQEGLVEDMQVIGHLIDMIP